MTTTTGRQPAPRRRGFGAAAGLLALCLAAAGAQATPVVSFTVQDIPDAGAADDWTITYTLSGSADAFESVNLLYDRGAYADLRVGIDPPELMTLAAQPDVALGADGQVTATLLSTLGAPVSFAVTVSWLGRGEPGAQPYEYLDANFSVLDTGTTKAPGGTVPEPQMLPAVLALAGIATWLQRRKFLARR